MTDIERVKQMVRDGRITEAEAEQLIAVLDTAQAADEELREAGEEIGAEARAIEAATSRYGAGAGEDATQPDATAAQGNDMAPLPPVDANPPREPQAPEPPRSPELPVPPQAPAAPVGAGQAHRAAGSSGTNAGSAPAPEGTRWVSLEMLAGELDVRVDENLEEPGLESDGPGDVIIERADNGFVIRWDQAGGSFLDRMLGRLRSGNLSLRLPPGYGLDLAATAGDVDMEGVPYLRGHLTAGDLDAKGLKGFDFTSRAGDIDIEAELTSGAHRINVTAGNVSLRLAPNSGVTIKADASIGDISSRLPGLETRSRSLGESLEGVFGNGAARLDMSVTTGSIRLGVGRG